MKVNLAEEFKHLQLGDPRRSKRFIKIVSQLVSNPETNICERCYNWADIKGVYRFFGNENVKETALAKGIAHATRDRCLQNEVVLCLQDTTNTAFDSSAKGLGCLDHGRGTGLMIHNIIAVDSQGCPLGILHQKIWARNPLKRGKAKTRHKRQISQKESFRWIDGVKKCEKELSDCKKFITIADREADIYELFAMPKAVNSELLIRATHDRTTLLGNKMWKEIGQQQVIAQFEVEIGDPTTGKIRIAKMSIRVGMLLLAPPKKKSSLPAICVHGILVKEDTAEKNKPLEWRLVSSMPVENALLAMQLVKFYSYRWRIERFHFILKSGCQLEHLQLRKVKALRKAIIAYSLSAFKLMQLLYESRINPEQPGTNYLSQEECQAIYIYNYKVKLVQKQPMPLFRAVWLLARMGGYIGRKNDGPPGIKTLWKGLQKLHAIMQVYQVSTPTYPHFGFG